MAKKQYAIARTVDFNIQFILDEVVAILGIMCSATAGKMEFLVNTNEFHGTKNWIYFLIFKAEIWEKFPGRMASKQLRVNCRNSLYIR